MSTAESAIQPRPVAHTTTGNNAIPKGPCADRCASASGKTHVRMGHGSHLADLCACAPGHIVLRGPLRHVVAHLGWRIIDVHVPEDSRRLVLARLGE